MNYNEAVKNRDEYKELMKKAKTPLHKSMIQSHLDTARLVIKNHIKNNGQPQSKNRI